MVLYVLTAEAMQSQWKLSAVCCKSDGSRQLPRAHWHLCRMAHKGQPVPVPLMGYIICPYRDTIPFSHHQLYLIPR